MMKKITTIVLLILSLAINGLCQGATPAPANPANPNRPPRMLNSNDQLKVRIKDVVRLKHSEKFILVGYGLVTGLNGTGDSDKNLTQSTIQNLLENFNIVVKRNDIKAQNTAAVTVTATVEHSAHDGDMITGTVAAIGDSTSLQGGELILTPLLGADAEVWAIAQGSVVTGGYSYGGGVEGGDSQVQNVPTTGMLTNGVKILRDVNTAPPDNDILTLYLQEPDFTSAVNLSNVINKEYLGCASAIDAATVKIRIPREFKDEGNIPTFISSIEQLEFHPDDKAKVVFNERTGTIVIGENVKISHAAICHGNITVNIKNAVGVSQPNSFSYRGNTKVINDQQTTVNQDPGDVYVIPSTTTVKELAQVLNDLGVKARDIIVIFHVLQQAGALHAELEAM